jgi:hypothetical protein
MVVVVAAAAAAAAAAVAAVAARKGCGFVTGCGGDCCKLWRLHLAGVFAAAAACRKGD